MVESEDICRFSVHITDAKILVLNEDSTISQFNKGKLGNSSSALYLSPTSIMFTGRWVSTPNIPSQAFIFTLPRGDLRRINPLKRGRGFHSMSWIEDQPAVIGGKDPDDNKLTSVEVLTDDDTWQEIAPLNIPRDNHTSCWTVSGTYTFGGWIDDSSSSSGVSKTSTIEKYTNGAWVVLDIALPFPCARVGVIPRDEQSFFLLGGNEERPSNKSWVFTERELLPLPPLDAPYSFENNLFILAQGTIKGLDRTGKMITYSIN